MSENRLVVALFKAGRALLASGWREGRYAPKDGTEIEVIELGSTGIHRARWEQCSFWIDGDCPCDPAYWRPIPGRMSTSSQTHQDAPGRARRTRVDCPGQDEQLQRSRLKRKALALLGRLQAGPMTNMEAIRIGGLRYGARIFELRQHKHVILTEENKRTGITTYTLALP